MARKPVRLTLAKPESLKTPEGRKAFAEAVIGRKLKKRQDSPPGNPGRSARRAKDEPKVVKE